MRVIDAEKYSGDLEWISSDLGIVNEALMMRGLLLSSSSTTSSLTQSSIT